MAASSNHEKAKSIRGIEPKEHVQVPPTRLFVRLPQEHRARAARPYTSLQKLRAELPASIGIGIKEVQAVPTGLTIISKDSASAWPAYRQSSRFKNTGRGRG